MTHASLLNSFWQIQQVRLSTWLEFSSVKEDSTLDFLTPRVATDFWRPLLDFKHWSCCFWFKEVTLTCLSSCCLQDFYNACMYMACLLCEFFHAACNVMSSYRTFLRRVYAYGYFPMWVRSCCLQADDWLMDFSYCLHADTCSPVWVRSCFLQWVELLKAFFYNACLYTVSLLCEFFHVSCNRMSC